MVKHGKFCHTHAGLIAEFGKYFIKSGTIDLKYGRFMSRIEQLREKSDYNCSYDVDEDDVRDMIVPAHELISIIDSMI